MLGISAPSESGLKTCVCNIVWLGVRVATGRRGRQSLGLKFQDENRTVSVRMSSAADSRRADWKWFLRNRISF